MIRPELLIPAGDIEKMRYAFAFGADAVYLGIPRFSLRSRENGFKNFEQVAMAVHYAHNLGKKIYVTANVFPHNHKLASFNTYIAQLLALCQPDAWIMSDPGLIMLMREYFPGQVIHISVQSNVINHASVRFWQNNGAKRIVVSREISIEEIKQMHEACPEVELESFVHGAVCMAYSGRCLISNYLSNRDGNQGACANSCRWKYKIYQKEGRAAYEPLEGQFYLKESERPGQLFELDEDENGSYLMNSKDLCAIHLLGQLRDAGVCSFKVEGRSKSVYYVAMTTRAYRRAIDDMAAGKPFNPELMQEILSTSNRGFIDGFLRGDPGGNGQEYLMSNSQYSSYRYTGIVRQYDALKKRLKVEARNSIKVGANYELCLPQKNIFIQVKELFNEKGSPINELHGGSLAGWISYPDDPGPFVLMREPITSL
ncbi:MAG: U32 family peptidase C-terminal domain-containing protein [Candidatus Omnitrophica bacterium]|nr:U32 family peptidase C-terminal domain-containing protein [Candidatus Omnitrophota bacterium]